MTECRHEEMMQHKYNKIEMYIKIKYRPSQFSQKQYACKEQKSKVLYYQQHNPMKQ